MKTQSKDCLYKIAILLIGLIALISFSVNAQNRKDKFVDTTVFKPEKCRDTTIRLYKPVAMLVQISETKNLYQWKKGYLRVDTIIRLGDCFIPMIFSITGNVSYTSNDVMWSGYNAQTAKELAIQKANLKANINYPDRFYYTDKKTLFRLEVLNYKFL